MITRIVVALLTSAVCNLAQQPHSAEITIHADQPGPTVNRQLFGQFAEHLGLGIYGGIWVGENFTIPNTHGYRNDVVQALRNLNVPVIRWPGGCFADKYNWREGVGPRAKPPVKINTHWGKVTGQTRSARTSFWTSLNSWARRPISVATWGPPLRLFHGIFCKGNREPRNACVYVCA